MRPKRDGARPIALVFFVSFLLSGLITALTGIPGAETHDEFSYLLAADTFAHGRLTNPPHPMWPHFESFHILQQPTYQSKYQPGQGLILALGQALTGWPIVGSWLATALACGAITWALRGSMPARWATLGGMLAALHPLVMLWSQNYWGGSLAALGGALVWGAAMRLQKKQTISSAAALAIGIALLFNTRPYEGLVFSFIVITPLLLFTNRSRWNWPAIGAVSAILLTTASWNLYYNHRVTGNAFKLPYLLHEEQYALAPPFIWQSERPEKTFRHEVIAQYNQAELAHYRHQKTLAGFATAIAEKLLILTKAYGAQPVIAIALIGLWYVKRRPAIKLAAITATVFIATLMPTNWTFAHYAAPGLVLLIFLITAGLRELTLRWRPTIQILALIYIATAVYWIVNRIQSYPQSWARLRQSLIADLNADPGDDLVLVRPAIGGNLNTDWVYNSANIDHSPIVFARDMGKDANAELIRYFPTRNVWLLDVGTGKITRYNSLGGVD